MRPEAVQALCGVDPCVNPVRGIRLPSCPKSVLGCHPANTATIEALAVQFLCAGAELDDGHLDTIFDDARRDRVAGETGYIVDVELLHETVAMFLDRFDADV